MGVENILVLCFSIQGGYSRVPAQSHTCTLVVEGFLECSLCWVITGLRCVCERVYMVFTFTTKRFFEVAIESWSECSLNPRTLWFCSVAVTDWSISSTNTQSQLCTATPISSFVQCKVSFWLLPSSVATFILIKTFYLSIYTYI